MDLIRNGQVVAKVEDANAARQLVRQQLLSNTWRLQDSITLVMDNGHELWNLVNDEPMQTQLRDEDYWDWSTPKDVDSKM